MANERQYYCFCGDKSLFETLTKEQIISAIQQMQRDGQITDLNAPAVNQIVNQKDNTPVTLWIGTAAEYATITNPDTHCLYMITDSNPIDSLESDVISLNDFAVSVGDYEKETGSVMVMVDYDPITSASANWYYKKYASGKVEAIATIPFYNNNEDTTFFVPVPYPEFMKQTLDTYCVSMGIEGANFNSVGIKAITDNANYPNFLLISGTKQEGDPYDATYCTLVVEIAGQVL